MRLNILSIVLTLAGLSTAAPSLSFEIERQESFTSNSIEPEILRIISTADIELFAPLITGFQASNPKVTVNYH